MAAFVHLLAERALDVTNLIRHHRLGDDFPAVAGRDLFQCRPACVVINALRRTIRYRNNSHLNLHRQRLVNELKLRQHRHYPKHVLDRLGPVISTGQLR